MVLFLKQDCQEVLFIAGGWLAGVGGQKKRASIDGWPLFPANRKRIDRVVHRDHSCIYRLRKKCAVHGVQTAAQF